MDKKTNNLGLKLGILATSLLISDATAISVTVAPMEATFSNISATTVESLVTIPSFSMLLFILLSNFVIRLIGKKKTVLLGLSMAFVGGVLPAFVTSFPAIIFCRFLLGAGVGTYNTLAVGLISDFFTGVEQKKLLGFQTATSAIGSALTTFLAGILVSYDWHYAYLVYALSIPILLVFYLNVPEPSKKIANDSSALNAREKNKIKLNSTVILSVVSMFFMFVFLMNIATKTSEFLTEQNIKNAAFLGTALTIGGLLGAVSGFLYGRVYVHLKNITPIFSSAVVALGFAGVAYSSEMILFTVGTSLVYIGYSMLISYLYGVIFDNVNAASKNISVSLAMVACNLGAFFSPYIVSIISNVIGNSSAKEGLSMSVLFYGVLAVIFVFPVFKKGIGSNTTKAIDGNN